MKFIRLKDEMDGYGKAWIIVLALLIVWILDGCGAMPSGVRMVDDIDVTVEKCIRLGTVQNDALHDLTMKIAQRDMLLLARDRGANTVMLIDVSETFYDNGATASIDLIGLAYHCDRPKD